MRDLMRRLGAAARGPGRIYLVGGASAVLLGWRATTVDVDLKLDPEPPGVFEAIARAKDALNVYAQALAKIERGHERDLLDVDAMRRQRLIEPARLVELFDAIEPALIRYPAIAPASFRDRVRTAAQAMAR